MKRTSRLFIKNVYRLVYWVHGAIAHNTPRRYMFKTHKNLNNTNRSRAMNRLSEWVVNTPHHRFKAINYFMVFSAYNRTSDVMILGLDVNPMPL